MLSPGAWASPPAQLGSIRCDNVRAIPRVQGSPSGISKAGRASIAATAGAVKCRSSLKRLSRKASAEDTWLRRVDDAEIPVDDSTISWGVLLLLASCAAVRDEVFLGDVTFEQGALAVAVPAACAFRARGEAPEWSLVALRACAFLACSTFLSRSLGDSTASSTHGLATAAVIGLAAPTFQLPSWLPSLSLLPWWSIAVVAWAASQGGELALSVGLSVGRTDAEALIWTTIAAWITVLALTAWSLWWVEGNHGPVQKMLGSKISLPNILPVAFANAAREEVEFRMLLQGALLAGPASESVSWVAVSVILQAAYFAVLHYRVGFPSGRSGFILVLIWALFLGFLRWWTGGMALVLLLHAQADVIIFLLVLLQEQKQKRLQTESNTRPDLFRWLGM